MTDLRRSTRDAYDEIAAAHDEHRNDAAPEMPLIRDLVEDPVRGRRA